MANGNDDQRPAAKDPEDWVTGDEPMTGPQQSYLETLSREAGEDLPDGAAGHPHPLDRDIGRHRGPFVPVGQVDRLHDRDVEPRGRLEA